jgi:hypothetical protein
MPISPMRAILHRMALPEQSQVYCRTMQEPVSLAGLFTVKGRPRDPPSRQSLAFDLFLEIPPLVVQKTSAKEFLDGAHLAEVSKEMRILQYGGNHCVRCRGVVCSSLEWWFWHVNTEVDRWMSSWLSGMLAYILEVEFDHEKKLGIPDCVECDMFSTCVTSTDSYRHMCVLHSLR